MKAQQYEQFRVGDFYHLKADRAGRVVVEKKISGLRWPALVGII